MTNNTSGTNTEIKVNGQELETVTSFKYLGSVISDEGSKPEILSRIAQTEASLTRLIPAWNDRVFLSVPRSWTFTAAKEEHKPWKRGATARYDASHVTNKEVRAKIQQAIRPHKDLLTIIKRCSDNTVIMKVSCSSALAKTILQGTVKGGRRQGRQRNKWEDNIREWTGLDFAKSQRAVENRENGGNWL